LVARISAWWTSRSIIATAVTSSPIDLAPGTEWLVDRVTELRARHPSLHLYHYTPHERSKLRSLSVAYATREDEVDDLLRVAP
jgi:hypothetical protein